ncbi:MULTISPECIES: hypothetical protein [unclassified Microbacterium]|uniref:hypothetical protein n=1 Tax=unclassified Microbacterium TaxID=2609290 RepID=UPI00214A9FB7|nr:MULTISPECIES: hypothetical protein [unclassified Microbacterium]MCR2783586.1 hypothetical protein [Microbacterium sp. zg.B96]WIM15555.1 hypothetical protein QNO11_13595 [Microbacterium sp. zg-B96]
MDPAPHPHSSNPPTGRIRIDPLGRGAWRLSDTTVEDAGLALFAYVEFTADGFYEAVWVATHAKTSRHSTLEDVTRIALDMMTDQVESRRTKPIPIAHRTPFTTN